MFNSKFNSFDKIAHAGGSVLNFKYSNSLEAIISAASRGFKVIELDVVKTSDGFAIAHDGMESSYGVESFSKVSSDVFNNLMVYGRFTPCTFRSIQNLKNDFVFIFDSKFKSLEDFEFFLDYLKKLDLLGYVIIQCYSFAEAEILRSQIDLAVIFAMWKNYGWNLFSKEAILTAKKIKDLNFQNNYISLSYIDYANKEICNLEHLELSKLIENSDRLMIHNIDEMNYDKVLSKGMICFMD